MRVIPAVITVFLLWSPSAAYAQAFVLQGSAGPTITDAGYSVAAGLGVAPTRLVSFLASVERTHLASRVRADQGGVEAFRGGTLTAAAAEVQVAPLGRNRIGPYVLAGLVIGLSQPNVTDVFRDRVANRVAGPFVGGGIQIPLRGRLSAIADVRMILAGGTDNDELFAVAPVRGGIAWRF